MRDSETQSATDEGKVEIYYEDHSVKHRLARLEASDDHIRYLIESQCDLLSMDHRHNARNVSVCNVQIDFLLIARHP